MPARRREVGVAAQGAENGDAGERDRRADLVLMPGRPDPVQDHPGQPRHRRGGGRVAWVEAIDGGPTVVCYVARLTDGGRTFSEPVRAHGAQASRPGFTTLAVGPDGTVQCAWLDGRNQGRSSRSSASAGRGPGSSIRSGWSLPVPKGRGLPLLRCRGCGRRTGEFVAFRNSEGGDRDIWLARSGDGEGGGFGTPVPFVYFNRTTEAVEADSATVDPRAGLTQLAEEIVALGHRRIGAVFGPLEHQHGGGAGAGPPRRRWTPRLGRFPPS